MKLIAHRGNIKGRFPEMENNPSYVSEALKKGFDVEIDVWKIDNKLFLGHDKPEFSISLDFLKNEKLWCHAKNISALYFLLKNNIHCFWHQNDAVTLTSKGYMWTFPGQELTPLSICLFPEERKNENYDFCKGICSDNIGVYKNGKK